MSMDSHRRVVFGRGVGPPPPTLWGQFSDQASELSDVTLAGEGMEQAWTPASPGLEKVFCRMEQLSKGVFHQYS
mgnify:CR=1 FL=1